MKLPFGILLLAAILLAACGPSAEEKAKNERSLRLALCVEKYRQKLVDPESLRYLNGGVKVYDKVQPATYHDSGKLMFDEFDTTTKFEYTATNAFGGRIRGKGFCLFLGRDLVFIDESNRS